MNPPEENDRGRITKKHLSAAVIVLSVGVFLALNWNFFLGFFSGPEAFKSHTQNLPFSISLAAVALIVAGSYYYSYEFFKQNFYFYICVSWIANAVYLILEKNGPPLDWRNSGEIFRYKVGILLLSLIPTALMFLALLSQGEPKQDQLRWRNLLIAVRGLNKGLLLTGALVGTAIDLVLLSYIVSISGDRNDFHLGLWLLPGSIISFLVLCFIGHNLKVRFLYTDSKRGSQIALTLYVYGALQFVYPLTPLIKDQRLLSAPFLLAQILKVINAILMMGVLQSARDREIETVNRELLDREKQLERQTRFADLGVLAASIKHDINTPLATMGSHIKAIKNRYASNSDIVRTMEKLSQSMTRISAIANIVDIIRKDSGLMDRESLMVRTGMLALAKNAVKLVKNESIPIVGRTVIRIKGREGYVRALVPLLEQVLVNIIKNGLEAILEAKQKAGSINIRVSKVKIPNSKHARWVRVDIVDNGRGIPEDEIGKLATGFTTRSQKKPNSGIGLLIGKRILHIHRGRLSFESKVGEGTTVTLLLPEWTAIQESAMHASQTGSTQSDQDPLERSDSPDDIVEETTYPQANNGLEKTGDMV